MHAHAALIQLLLARLERISVDSTLAHRASGIRGSLLRSLDNDTDDAVRDHREADAAIRGAIDILRQAAFEKHRGRRTPV